jgi:hypothetical protein
MTTYALEKLYADVQADMALHQFAGVAHYFGWREPSKQLKPIQRIQWVPGDDGKAGTINPARFPGIRPLGSGTMARSVQTWDELFTVYISDQDPSNRTDEFLQWSKVRALADAWIASVYRTSHGTYTIYDMRWETEKTEHRFGATLRVVGGIMSMVADLPGPLAAPVDTVANVTPRLTDPPKSGTDDTVFIVLPSP